MTGKERMQTTLRFVEPDRPPHFESMFELEWEAFGLRFPDRRDWATFTPREHAAAVAQCLTVYERIVRQYRWDGLLVYWPWSDPAGVAAAREAFPDLLVGGVVGGALWCIDSIHDWEQFAVDLAEAPERLHAEAERRCRAGIERVTRLTAAGAEFVLLPHDVAFNTGPFVSPAQFGEFVAPYWRRLVEAVQAGGAYAFIHSDGQIMPILDHLLSLGADLLHSLDPMAGVDLAAVKRRTAGRLALMGNVQCNLLQDGPPEAIRASVEYALEHGTPGGGYVFSSSNTIFPGMPLANYEWMLACRDEWLARRARGGPNG
ncbi:MAG: hypothetical protein IT204_19870 [Fimbriimonadaceae bacterium]|nr:hypothetical protein [Fimbriimonadaceae bacterium]